MVDALAAILAAEDARQFNGPLFRSAARHPVALVRSRTALAIGRIGDAAGTRTLVELTTDPDTMVQHDAMFAIGLVGSEGPISRVREFVLDPTPNGPMFDEAVVAAARIGGPRGGELIREMLNRWVGLSLNSGLPSAVRRALLESWRLGEYAPVRELLQYAVSTDRQVRRNVVYSLGRLREAKGINVFFSAADDPDPMVRVYAARALRAEFADSARLERRAAAQRVERLVNDPDRRVRMEALRSLATFAGVEYVRVVANRTADPDPNVRMEAVTALGQMGGADAAMALREQLSSGLFSIERQSLLSLARVEGTAAMEVVGRWAEDVDWRRREAAARAYRTIGAPATAELMSMIWDQDPRVVVSVLTSALAIDSSTADSLARRFLVHEDEVVRSVAFGYLARQPLIEDLSVFIEGFDRARHDQGGGTRAAIIRALGTLAGRDDGWAGRVERAFLGRYPVNPDFRDRLVAEARFPLASEKWGPVRPVVTSRTIDDYRDIIRELVLPALRGKLPRMIVETDRGTIVIDLHPHIAPLTVQAYTELIDRRYFDGGAWHRVVPNFVVQDGDPRGDGRGSAGFTLRDEVSRLRYERGSVGLARTARFDTGGSQFFITVSPQPHLEGAYTIFGTVRSGQDVLDRITIGDRIRRIRKIDNR